MNSISTDSKPLVSIITGYYNRIENLEVSVQSILDQSYSNFEYIIFDDCSTDATKELLEKFSDPRLTLYRHSINLGFTKGAIQAVALAKGKYIAIHGAGDVSHPKRIEKQVELLESDPEIGIVGCLIEDDYEGNKSIYTPDNNAFTHGEVMYHKSLYYRVGGYNALFPVGQFTYLKAEILKISKGDYVKEVLYQRKHFSNGITRNPKKRFLQKFMIKAGAELASGSAKLTSFDKNSIYLAAYISLVNERSPADSSEFLKNYDGSTLVRILVKAYEKKFLPRSFLKKALSRFGRK